MLKNKFTIGIWALVLIGLVSFFTISTIVHGGTENQLNYEQQSIDNITSVLVNNGIPIITAEIRKDTNISPPLELNVLDFTVQSTSKNNLLAPLDPIYSNMIYHKVYLLMNHDISMNIQAVGVTYLNTKGEFLEYQINAIQKEDILLGKQNDKNPEDISAVLTSIPSVGMNLSEISVSQDETNTLKCKLKYRVSDVIVSNTNIVELSHNIRKMIFDMNENQDVAISYYEVWIDSTTNEPILRYINDIQLSHFSGWKADNLSLDWSSIQ
jgi:hypothetical protein